MESVIVSGIETRLPYCEHPFVYRRRKTRVVHVGDVGIGGDHPIRIQSMTTTDTMDTQGTVRQVAALADAGCEIVRITAPSIKEAENLKNIRHELRARGIRVPLVADIHFTPNAAMKAAEWVEKVRINPGNFADRKKFAVYEYTDAEYEEELERIDETFRPLVLRCRENGVAMRIGTNHGSLSDRILNRYGDTPEGMVESALEFVHLCERYDFHEIVLSMKSSNVQVMIGAYRLLAARMRAMDMDYPFHLGVTEAGDGEDGRIKSAVGIGSLLEDGIGDTIRVSLTEDPVAEIPAARAIAAAYGHKTSREVEILPESRSPYRYERRWTTTMEVPHLNVGGIHPVRVWVPLRHVDEFTDLTRYESADDPHAEIVEETATSLSQWCSFRDQIGSASVALAANVGRDAELALSVIPHADIVLWNPSAADDCLRLIRAVAIHEKKGLVFDLRNESFAELTNRSLEICSVAREENFRNFAIRISHSDLVHVVRYVMAGLERASYRPPVILRFSGSGSTVVRASIDMGALLCDGWGDAIGVDDPSLSSSECVRLAFNILQATRLRISKTEFISCPSCGRTLFDLQEVTGRIKARTGHLKGVKIAIMGCIVNGPGEMADADFGYVGAAAGKINLYVGKELVERNIDMSVADERLVALIKQNGRWVEPAS